MSQTIDIPIPVSMDAWALLQGICAKEPNLDVHALASRILTEHLARVTAEDDLLPGPPPPVRDVVQIDMNIPSDARVTEPSSLLTPEEMGALIAETMDEERRVREAKAALEAPEQPPAPDPVFEQETPKPKSTMPPAIATAIAASKTAAKRPVGQAPLWSDLGL